MSLHGSAAGEHARGGGGEGVVLRKSIEMVAAFVSGKFLWAAGRGNAEEVHISVCLAR